MILLSAKIKFIYSISLIILSLTLNAFETTYFDLQLKHFCFSNTKPEDTLKKRKEEPLKLMSDYEKNEYNYVDDPYSKTCKRLLLNNIINGYTDKISYNPGDTVKIYLNANGTIPNIKLFLFNVLGDKQDSLRVNVFPQNSSGATPWENYGYSLTFKYIIPLNLQSGIYNFGNTIFFIVKSASKNADITIVYPSNTEGAYNNSGGKSLYDFNSSNNVKASLVTFQRPLSNFILNEIQQHSYPFMKWLKGLNGYSIQYIQDVDLDNYHEIMNSKLLIVIGHSEYWSRKARFNFDKFVDLGNDAAVLSGNTMCWQVRYNTDKSGLICHKNITVDPEMDPLLKSVLWTEPTLNYPVLKSIGCDWPRGAYGMHAYHGNYGYTVLLPNSPLLQGTGLGFHSLLSCQSYEYDATLFTGFDHLGDLILDSTTLGFCKIELLGYDYGNSTTTTAYTPKGFGTFVVFKKTPSSGIIVNTAFNTFTGKTPSYGSGGICGPDSSKIRTITLNIFSKLLNKENVFAHPNLCTISGIKENNYDSGFNSQLIFPNPGNRNFTIKTIFKQYNHPTVDIYDYMGEKLYSKELENNEINQLDLSSLNEGTYFYILYNDHQIITRNKITIIR